jgi:hypothetical protein
MGQLSTRALVGTHHLRGPSICPPLTPPSTPSPYQRPPRWSIPVTSCP